MKKKILLKISTLIPIGAAFYLAYYLLLKDTFLHVSISSIIMYANSLNIQKHLLILGLLPVYIAAMIFGAVILGSYIGSSLQYLIIRSQD